jgi:hypothetical protein
MGDGIGGRGRIPQARLGPGTGGYSKNRNSNEWDGRWDGQKVYIRRKPVVVTSCRIQGRRPAERKSDSRRAKQRSTAERLTVRFCGRLQCDLSDSEADGNGKAAEGEKRSVQEWVFPEKKQRATGLQAFSNCTWQWVRNRGLGKRHD